MSEVQIIENRTDKHPAVVWEETTNAFLDQCSGVIHVGANTGQERGVYADRELPVVWVEPTPGVFDRLVENLRGFPGQQAAQLLLTDQDGAEHEFFISNNGAQSSSIFEFGGHKEIWPGVDYIGSVKLKSTRLDTFVSRAKLDLSVFNALILDVQGAELLALKGAGDCLERFKFIRCEAADFEVYKGCCQLKDLDAFLIPRGFERVNTWRGAGRPEIGYAYEVLYERKAASVGEVLRGEDTDRPEVLEVKAKVAALTSVPRLGFQAHWGVTQRGFRCGDFEIPLFKFSGAFWEQHIQNGLIQLIEQGVDWVITVDYDSIFDSADVKELLTLAAQYPEADAIVPWQVKRGKDKIPLFSIIDRAGNLRQSFDRSEFECDLTRIATGHFGLTLLKTAAIRELPKPWFWSQPNPANGEWDKDRVDADVYFWREFKKHGRAAFVANNVRIGHIDEEIFWIDRNYEIVRQTIGDFNENGKPESCR